MRALVSARLGADFRKLWTASAVSNLGDGVTMVAGPLLVSTLTTDPAAVAGAVFAQQLPWLLFALVSGVWADRLDRRRLVVAVNVARALAIAALTTSIAAGVASVPVIYLVFFILGTGETLADTASSAFVPAIVAERHLPVANSLLAGTFTLINQFAAKPFGAWLFTLSAALPFGLNMASFLASAALIASLRTVPPPDLRPSPTTPGQVEPPPAASDARPGPALPDHDAPPGSPGDGVSRGLPDRGASPGLPGDGVSRGLPDRGASPGLPGDGVLPGLPDRGAPSGLSVDGASPALSGRGAPDASPDDGAPGGSSGRPPVTVVRRSLAADIGAGLRFLWGHRLLRTLAVTMAFGNLVFCAAFAIFVLYSRSILGLSSFGYGLLLTAFAVGGLLGTVLAPALLRVVGATWLLRIDLLVEAGLHATLAATTSPWLAAAAIVLFSTCGAVWGTVVVTIRQRSVPPALYGRATSVYALLDLGGAAVGSLLGGLFAQTFGLLPTFWTAAAAMSLIAAAAWRPLSIATAALNPRSATPVR
ncbi:MFS transporter [Actinoplanes sp. NPDC049265]|uniref:MFS transporter n=1 Tax=Actinoplanes sp. NPDC049265 TaxID=3363902 RepID=UPI003721B69E